MVVNHWDLIIFGAGPSGLALARNLGSQKRVLIVERRAISPEGPRIGESLPGGASILLQRLGLFDQFLAGPHRERGAILSVWDNAIPVWRDAVSDPAGPGWHLDRRAFDRLLREGALAAGAILLEGIRRVSVERQSQGWRVDLHERGETHSAPVLVDASGRCGVLTRKLGLSICVDDSLLCIYTFLDGCNDDEDATTRILADDHGWWYTTQIPHQQRVLAYHLDIKSPLWRQWKTGFDFLAYSRRHSFIAEAIKSLMPSRLRYCHAGTAMLDVSTLDQAGPGFIAIGDALLAFDPVSSQGIFHALASAASAANAINNDFPGSYNAFKHFKDEMEAVCYHYLRNLQKTYQGPKRLSNHAFWSNRYRAL